MGQQKKETNRGGSEAADGMGGRKQGDGLLRKTENRGKRRKEEKEAIKGVTEEGTCGFRG